MHIVFVTFELATENSLPGGLGSFTANMARIFAGKGHEVTVLWVTSKEEKEGLGSEICVENIYVHKSLWNFTDKISRIVPYRDKYYNEEFRRFLLNLYKGRKVKKELNKINKREKIDIVHYCNHGAFSLFHNKKIPYAVRVSGFLNIWKAADRPEYKLAYKENPLTCKEHLEEYAMKKAKYVISPSVLLAEIARKDIGIKVVVLESPFWLSRENWDYRFYNETAEGKKYILHYGRLSYLKGTHVVAQIVHTLLKSNPDLTLVLVGTSKEISDDSGNQVHIHEMVKKNAGEYSDRVIFTGPLGREQLYPFIQNAELCLLPARIENLPNTCIEAMAMGKIVVATNGASFEQLIDDRKSGFLCERDNPDSFLQAIDEALHMDSANKARMITNATARIKLLSPNVIYDKYLEFYKKVIEEW